MMCVDHQVDAKKLGYLEWHEKAQESLNRKEDQEQCGECQLWFFPWERSTELPGGDR